MHFGSSTCWQVDGDSCRSRAKRRIAGELAARLNLQRFILIGLYTGTRHEANFSMHWGINAKGGWRLVRSRLRCDVQAWRWRSGQQQASNAGSDT